MAICMPYRLRQRLSGTAVDLLGSAEELSVRFTHDQGQLWLPAAFWGMRFPAALLFAKAVIDRISIDTENFRCFPIIVIDSG